MDKRRRAVLNLKLAAAQGAPAAWWDVAGGNPATPDPAPVTSTNYSAGGDDGLSSSLFGASTETTIDPDVQQRVITLVSIIKELSLKFYNLTLSDTEALKIAKENLKDISSRISHIPVEALTDVIDDHLNKIDKGVSNSQQPGANAEGGNNAKAEMPVTNPAEPAKAEEAPPAGNEQAPAPEEEPISFGSKLASKQSAIYDESPEYGDEFAEDYIETDNPIPKSPQEVWLKFTELMDSTDDETLFDIYDSIKEQYGDMPFQHGSFLLNLYNKLVTYGTPEVMDIVGEIKFLMENQRGIKREPLEEEPIHEDRGKLKGLSGYKDKPEWEKKPKFMGDWDNEKLAALYSEKKASINRHFNVETLQQFINVASFNPDNFEYFLKTNSNDNKKNTPW